jgi:hypothetical protein
MSPTGVQQSILYLHNIAQVLDDGNVIFFIDINNMILATAPIPSRIAYVSMGGNNPALTDYNTGFKGARKLPASAVESVKE